MQHLLVLWTAVLLLLAPYEPRMRVQEIARTILLATPDLYERALLATISFHETTLGRSGVPFGVVVYYRTHTNVTLAQAADAALVILRYAERVCGRRPALQLGHFHHGGGCRADAFSRTEARTHARIVAMRVQLSPM